MAELIIRSETNRQSTVQSRARRPSAPTGWSSTRTGTPGRKRNGYRRRHAASELVRRSWRAKAHAGSERGRRHRRRRAADGAARPHADDDVTLGVEHGAAGPQGQWVRVDGGAGEGGDGRGDRTVADGEGQAELGDQGGRGLLVVDREGGYADPRVRQRLTGPLERPQLRIADTGTTPPVEQTTPKSLANASGMASVWSSVVLIVSRGNGSPGLSRGTVLLLRGWSRWRWPEPARSMRRAGPVRLTHDFAGHRPVRSRHRAPLTKALEAAEQHSSDGPGRSRRPVAPSTVKRPQRRLTRRQVGGDHRGLPVHGPASRRAGRSPPRRAPLTCIRWAARSDGRPATRARAPAGGSVPPADLADEQDRDRALRSRRGGAIDHVLVDHRREPRGSTIGIDGPPTCGGLLKVNVVAPPPHSPPRCPPARRRGWCRVVDVSSGHRRRPGRHGPGTPTPRREGRARGDTVNLAAELGRTRRTVQR